MDLIGDRWTLLIVRDLFLGRQRYKEFASSPERIPTNILADRLARLCASGVIVTVPAADGSKYLGYQLTPKGRALRPVVEAMREWGLKWEKGTRAILSE